jgi:hypothetical protein
METGNNDSTGEAQRIPGVVNLDDGSFAPFKLLLVLVKMFLLLSLPVRVRVRINPPHPLVCRKRRLNGAVLRMRPEKQRPCVTAGVAR